ncbi:IS4 family transposase [Microbulbifer sp. OS29]|uniref:IS4 family transposase n=2 Tax=Microbulbifer okhotskensis TaxID=2926617 RepID=A0A9X2J5R0_9GAMM|nr:IS4 family transposase [Microbulbifer okhotskensis]
MLLTDLPVEDFKQARVIIEWYRSRWEIETYFRVLKGGCQIESNRFRTEQRMLNCIAIYMIIGWRLHSITTQARRLPEAPCTSAYSEKEWRMTWMIRDKTTPPNEPPSMREITRMLAGLGGFLGRKGDGEPGVKTVWQGYTKLLHYIEAAEALNGLK